MKKTIITVASLLTIGYSLLTNSAKAQVVSTLAGTTTSGSADGTGTAASFYQPIGVCSDGSGNLYVADQGNNEIRKIVISTGVVTTLAGSTTSGHADGTGTAASFWMPTGVCTDGSGNLYVADQANNEIRKIVIATGVVTTLAGTYSVSGSADGTGTAASFNGPTGVCTDGSGNLYVADYVNNEIRKIVIATGVVTTLCGSTTSGHADGTGVTASFYLPSGVATDGIGNLYVADQYNHEIRKIVISTGVVTTLCGSTTLGHADGTGTAASFNYPRGVCSDGSGNLYVSDYYNNEIRKIVISTGVVTTLAGTYSVSGSADGTGTAASFNYPAGVCSDASGNLYVADTYNNEIRMISNCTTPTVTVNSATVCVGNTATLTATGATTYSWSNSATTTSITPSPTVTTSYTVTGANGTCTNSATSMVTVYALPTVSNIPNPSGYCAGGSTHIFGYGASTYSWTPATGLSATTGSAVVANPTVTTIYTLTGTDVHGCENTATSTITVSPLPLVVVTPTTATICAGSSTALAVSSVSNASTYTWSTSATTLSITVTPTVTTTYTLTGTAGSGSGCKNTATSTVTVNACLGIQQFANSNEVNIYPNPNNGLFNLSISQFDNAKTNSVEIYNTIGGCVHRQIITSSNSQIDTSGFAEGVYTISIISNDGVVNKRVVIVR